MMAICRCGSTSYEGEKPFCDRTSCHRRWWAAVGVPFLLLLAGILAWGLHVGPDAPCVYGCTTPGTSVSRPATTADARP